VLEIPESDEFADVIVAVIEGRLAERDIVEALRRHAVRLARPDAAK
jgi:hypothetical protein